MTAAAAGTLGGFGNDTFVLSGGHGSVAAADVVTDFETDGDWLRFDAGVTHGYRVVGDVQLVTFNEVSREISWQAVLGAMPAADPGDAPAVAEASAILYSLDREQCRECGRARMPPI